MVASYPAWAENHLHATWGVKNTEGGNLWACPKPYKVKSWVAPCQPAGGREKKMLAQLLGQPLQGLHPYTINNYYMPPPPHPSGVKVAPS